jgi:hypothetical protein
MAAARSAATLVAPAGAHTVSNREEADHSMRIRPGLSVAFGWLGARLLLTATGASASAQT